MKAAPRALRLPGPMALAHGIGERSDAVLWTAVAGCLTCESETTPARAATHRRHSGARRKARTRNPEAGFSACIWIPGSRAPLAPRNDSRVDLNAPYAANSASAASALASRLSRSSRSISGMLVCASSRR